MGRKQVLLIGLMTGLILTAAAMADRPAAAFEAPVVKWIQDCSNWECSNAMYSSPAAVDLDGNGTTEVIYAAEHLFILNGADGGRRLKTSTGRRVWPGIVAADLDNDGDLELVTGDNADYLRVWDHNGQIVWQSQPTGDEIRSLCVFDLDNNGDLEILAGRAGSGRQNLWVLEHDRSVRPGWPQLADDSGHAAGIYNANVAAADLDGDSQGEIIVPSDVHYICAYRPDGAHIRANAMYGDKAWGKVGVWESLATELKGWGECNGDRQESYRTNFAHGPAAIGDVNGDGSLEVVAVGNVYDCHVGDNEAGARYNGVYIFNADRSRFNASGFDWNTVPTDTGSPLSTDYNVIENCQPNPVLADLDGDGQMEILFSSYDGRVHAFWLDKTEHHNWPFAVYQAAQGYFTFAAEPAVADLDNDGRAEVIICTWTQIGSNRTGRLYVLDYQGNRLHVLDLPGVPDDRNYNGALAGPTLADIDDDPDLEILVVTRYTGLAAYDVPDTANARILWGTGRGNYQRNGLASPEPKTVEDDLLMMVIPAVVKPKN